MDGQVENYQSIKYHYDLVRVDWCAFGRKITDIIDLMIPEIKNKIFIEINRQMTNTKLRETFLRVVKLNKYEPEQAMTLFTRSIMANIECQKVQMALVNSLDKYDYKVLEQLLRSVRMHPRSNSSSSSSSGSSSRATIKISQDAS